MIIGEPARSLLNPAFRLKMILLAFALVLTWLLQMMQRRDPALGDTGSVRGAAMALAAVSIVLWSGIIFAGRWIAYYS
jgi:hypothetical protein